VTYAQMCIFLFNIFDMVPEQVDMIMEKAKKEGHASDRVDILHMGSRPVRVTMVGTKFKLEVA